MNRRSFLSSIALGSAGFALDPEQLLWRKTKTIFLPSPRTYSAVFVGNRLNYRGLLPVVSTLAEAIRLVDVGGTVFVDGPVMAIGVRASIFSIPSVRD